MEAMEPSEEDSDTIQLKLVALSSQIVGSVAWLLASVAPQVTHSKEIPTHCRSTNVYYNWQKVFWLNVTR